jgi:hypothetical protein
MLCRTALAATLFFLMPSENSALFAQPDVRSAVEVRGFLSTSLFAQDALFAPGSGQNAQHVVRRQDGPAGWWHGADVRNTRLEVHVDAAKQGDWAIGGLLELDLFGGFPSGESFDREQAYPRLRLAFAEFERVGSRLRVGQEWAPLSHDMPQSVNRLAFPPGWGAAGVIGWRFPGVFVRQRIAAAAPAVVHVHLAAMRGDWIGDAEDADRPTAGQASLVPQLQAAVEFGAPAAATVGWGLRVGAHADRKRAPRPGVAAPPSGWGFAASGHIAPAPVTLRLGGYTGHAIGHLAALSSQLDDLRGSGVWTQIGVELGRAWGARGFVGIDSPLAADVRALGSGILENRTATVELYHDRGAWAVGMEWQDTRTAWWDRVEGEAVRHGNQAALGALVRF